MTVVIPLSSGASCTACTGGTCHGGCPYAAPARDAHIEWLFEAEQRYPGEWLAFVVPPDEDDYAPERGILVAHSDDDAEVWDTVAQIKQNQVVHVYFNGSFEHYLAWADAGEAEADAPQPAADIDADTCDRV